MNRCIKVRPRMKCCWAEGLVADVGNATDHSDAAAGEGV